MINYDLPVPIKGYVAEKYLYDMDASKAGYVDAKLMGISSYPGDALTFTVMITQSGPGEGSMFSYLPIDAFVVDPFPDTPFEMKDLVYHNCPEGEVAISAMANFPKDVWVYLKGPNVWVPGKYVATLDWYTGNDLLHLITLNNGQFAAMPNHKVKFGNKSPKAFATYKKLHATWKV